MGITGIATAVFLTFIVWLLISKFIRNSYLTEHYGRELYRHAQDLIDDEDTPDMITVFAVKSFHLATQRFATLIFVVLWVVKSVLPRRAADGKSRELVRALENASHPQKEKLSKLVFAMVMVLKSRSLLLGWLVLPMLRSIRASNADHPASFNDEVEPRSVLRAFPGNLADC